MEVQNNPHKGSKLTGPNALSRIQSNNAASLQLLEAKSVMNTHFESDPEEDEEEDEQVLISEMLAVLSYNNINKEEIINMDNSTNLLLASFGHNAPAITWDIIIRIAKDDETNRTLSNWISSGCTRPPSSLPQNLKSY